MIELSQTSWSLLFAELSRHQGGGSEEGAARLSYWMLCAVQDSCVIRVSPSCRYAAIWRFRLQQQYDLFNILVAVVLERDGGEEPVSAGGGLEGKVRCDAIERVLVVAGRFDRAKETRDVRGPLFFQAVRVSFHCNTERSGVSPPLRCCSFLWIRKKSQI